jgi:hypothetical protein
MRRNKSTYCPRGSNTDLRENLQTTRKGKTTRNVTNPRQVEEEM